MARLLHEFSWLSFDASWHTPRRRAALDAGDFALLGECALARPAATAAADRARGLDARMMRDKKAFLETQVLDLACWEGAHGGAERFERVRALATEKMRVVLGEMFALRAGVAVRLCQE